MLKNLIINNIVLIDKLNLDFASGLCVLTGETGSGKSILLDALGLAIGYRSSSRLLRIGEDNASVVADFDITINNSCKKLLKKLDIDFDDDLIIRRILYKDGRSKAYINDIPVTQNLLKSIGQTLVEIHGQNEQSFLLNSSFHRNILDEYGNLIKKTESLSKIYDDMQKAKRELNEFFEKKNSSNKEKEYMLHIINEIDSLNIHIGEEKELIDKRVILMNKEKIMNIIYNIKNNIDNEQNNISKSITSSINILFKNISLGENLIDNSENIFELLIKDLEQTNINLNEAIDKINLLLNTFEFEKNTLEDIEERLYLIKSLARKLNVQSDDLLKVKKDYIKQLSLLNDEENSIFILENKYKDLREKYINEANILSKSRKQVAKELKKALLLELIPLKMEKTLFDIEFKELDEDSWNKYGIDSIKFIASTNPGMPLDDLSKIASGGELSRFMLALKVVLSQINSVPTLIFDEIDTGIDGAVADAVGERLKKLGQNLQVLVVTHLAQVASKGNFHLKVIKEQNINKTNTNIQTLDTKERIYEIARMIAGDNISEDALKLAKQMLNN